MRLRPHPLHSHRTPACMAAAAVASVLLAGCGSSPGQASALEACKAYTNATTGVETPAQRDAALVRAEQWAQRAAAKAVAWQALAQAIKAYGRATTASGTPATGTRHAAQVAQAAINSACEAASKGF